jgi:hypothetical protein
MASFQWGEMKAATQCFSLSSSGFGRAANDDVRHGGTGGGGGGGGSGVVQGKDDPRLGWLGSKWAKKAERRGSVPRKGSVGDKEEWGEIRNGLQKLFSGLNQGF